MKLGSSVSQTLIFNQAQALAQSYLAQARLQKTTLDLKWALVFYDKAEVTFEYIAGARQLAPALSEVKSALSQARTPQTAEEDELRQRIAEVYFERAELLEELGNPDKAQASYKKANEWGHANAADKLRRLGQRRASEASMAHLSFERSGRQAAPQGIDEKSALVDYLFTKTLLTLKRLDISKESPSLFLVYAHDTREHSQANASTSKYFIEKLSTLKLNLYSDQTPTGQPCFSTPADDRSIENILTNQLCLLPTGLGNSKPVNKVIVCCSEVLGNYLKKWGENGQYYADYCSKLEEAYHRACEQQNDGAIRRVVEAFSQEEPYSAGFHHVLTEIAFLQIRRKKLESQHGIIPISLTQDSYQQCLKEFIETTTVRIEDIPRFEEGKEMYPNQSRHWTMFKLIERLLTRNREAKILFDKFWEGYSYFIADLKDAQSAPKALEFAERLDCIFGEIEVELHRELASTVRQAQEHLLTLHADPRAALKAQYFDALEQDEAFKETRELYVEARGKVHLSATDTFNLLPQVQDFLKDKHVILLTGNSGAGKTTFNRVLEKQLWDKKKEPDAIPLFISLASMDKPEHDLIPKALKKRGLSEFQIQTLKKEKQKFVFILDGYDEIRQTQNLYLSNSINQSGGWQGHMVISCRSEYLGQDYRSRFQPNPIRPGEAPSFQEVVIEPFSEVERNQYLEKYVQHNATDWTVQQYQDNIKELNLQDLVSKPFLLRVVLEALPYLENEVEARSAIQLRMDLYDQFVRLWFERNEQRLSTQNLTGTKREVFRELSDDGLAQHGIAFAQDLAVHLYTDNAGNPVINYSSRKDKGNWKNAFFGREEEKQLLREAWPLNRNGNQYRFIHKSLLEYFAARSLFESFDACMAPKTRSRRDSDASTYSFEDQPVPPARMQKDVSLAPKHWVCDLGVVQWLTERVEQESTFKNQLFKIIERSKTDKTVRKVAANAITILVKAGVQFNGKDFQGIQIPGADLSDGVFDHAQLQGADLRKAHLRKIWLRQANLSGAQMAGVQFGEWPYLKEGSAVNSCAYSPLDGKTKTCAVGLANGTISVYDTSNWKKIHTLGSDNGSPVQSVVYSPNRAQLASGGMDGKVQLWNTQTGKLSFTFPPHKGRIWSVAYLPGQNSQQLASGSEDGTVRLWDAQSHKLLYTFPDHKSPVLSVVYSPNGRQLASSSKDGTVRLWDVQSHKLLYTFPDHKSPVWRLAYSPDGQQLASGSDDGAVRLWNVQFVKPLYTFSDHKGRIWSMEYSPNGRLIATSSEDSTVKLWSVDSKQCRAVIQGFYGTVMSVAWTKISNSDDNYLVTGCKDRSVRLWRVIEKKDQVQVRLCWSSRHAALTVTEASIQNVQGLSRVNTLLLQQHGAVGESSLRSCEVS